MKLLVIPFSAFLAFPNANAQAPEVADSTGLPGDHFSLQGALELFKNANDLEQFETALNTESNQVNNLDLDGNGEIDYVRVTSQKEGDAVVIMLRVPVSKEETQDVAVIELEKTGEESAILQIRGDEDLYPAETIIEPFAETEAIKEGKGPFAPEIIGVQVVVNVWGWSCPRWCFSARYYPWDSPWYWGYYPGWWRPWHPHPWRAWHGWGHRYHAWYRPWNSCRVVHAHRIYGPRRMHSQYVRNRYKEAHVRHAAARPARTIKPDRTPKQGPKTVRPNRTSPRKVAPTPTPKGSPKTTRPPRVKGKKGR